MKWTNTHAHVAALLVVWLGAVSVLQTGFGQMPCCSVTARLLLPHSSVWPLAHCGAFCCVRLAVCCTTLSLFIAYDRCGFNLSVYNKKRQKAPSVFIQSAPSIPHPPPQPSGLSSLLIQSGPALLTRASGCYYQSALAGLCTAEGWAVTAGKLQEDGGKGGWRDRRKGNKGGGTGVNPAIPVKYGCP